MRLSNNLITRVVVDKTIVVNKENNSRIITKLVVSLKH